MDIFSSSSDEELEEVLEMLPDIRLYRPRLDPFNHFSDSEFSIRYRFTKETVMYILDLIQNELQIINNRGRPITALNQLLIALRFYATGTFQCVVGDLIHVHKSVVCKIIKKISHLIALLRYVFITMPNNPHEILRTKTDFYTIRNFPNIIGCIDCTHIKIQSPGQDDAELYRNRKGFFSINVQAVCNASLLFTEITARWRGSVHDSTIFNASQLRADFELGRYPNSYLLGDNGYQCRNYMLTPILQPNSPAEARYNASHIQTRNTIERAFGVLKRRFPCLSVGLRTKISTTVSIIVAAAVLHNIAIKQNEAFVEYDDQEEEENDEIPFDGDVNDNQIAVRNNVIATVFTNN